MSWLEVNKVDQRKEFILRYHEGERMSDLCREYQITRKTGYKFLHRFERYGFPGLQDLSRRPHHMPRKTDELMTEMIIKVKEQYPTWGPKKIKAKLEERYPGVKIPASSTIGGILDKNGLVRPKKRRIHRSYPSSHLIESTYPNEVWAVDYKGEFRTKDKKYCYPLTITDHYSRFIIACEAMESTNLEGAFEVFRENFTQYGIPKVILSDNGAPFASPRAIFGLTKLSAWFMNLGIEIARIKPGKPQQNGRHERMHRTLNQDSLRPPAANILQQQEKFDTFKHIFNKERPHEALDQKVPADIYTPSSRAYIEKDLEYPTHDFTRRVNSIGQIRFLGAKPIFISGALSGYNIGIRELEEKWLVSFANYDIGFLDKET